MRQTVYEARFQRHSLFCAALLAVLLAGSPQTSTAALKDDARADFYQRALELIDKKDYPGAVILLKNALQVDARDLSARVELASTYLKLEDGLSAEKELLRARRDGARENFVIAPLGRAYLLQGKYEQIISQITIAGTSPEVTADVLRVRGLAYLAQRSFADAEDAFRKSIDKVPTHEEPYIGLARVAIGRNLLDAATTEIKNAIKHNPVSAEAWFVDGEVQRLQNRADAALERYDRAVEIAPDFHRALLARARILIDRGQHLKAEPDIVKVRREQRRDPNAAYLHALILTAKNNVAGARDALNDADEILKAIGPEFIRFDPPMLLLAGVVSYFRKDFETAYGQLNQYHREVPHHLGARKLLAALEIGRGSPVQAVTLLEPVAKANPDDFEVQVMLGDALMRAGRRDESAKVFERAATIAPTNSSAISQLAMLRLVAGQEDAAVEHLESALKRAPNATHLAVMLSLAQLKRGQNEAAIRTAKPVAEREPGNPVPYNLMAGAYLKLGKFDEARRNFEAAIAASPKYRPAIANLAKLEVAQRNYDRAFELYNRILEMDPLNGRTMMALADVESKRGHNSEAIRWLVKARATSRDRNIASLRLVEAYIAGENFELAIRTAEGLQSQDPGNITYLAALGGAYLNGKQLGKAAKIFSELSTRAKEAKSALWVHRAGEWQERSRDVEGARRSFEEAISINPRFLPPRLALFRHDMIARNYDRALARAGEIARTAPKSHLGDALRGDVYMELRKFDLAAAAYDRAVQDRPDIEPAIALRTYRAKRAIGVPDALAFVERWAANRPRDDIAARTLLANAYTDVGRKDRAIEIYEALLAKHSGDATLLNNLAVLYAGRDDGRALVLAKQAADVAPGSAAVLDTYGWLLVRQGKLAEGFGMLRNAHLRAPGVPEIRYHMAVALEALGRRGDALREVNAALRSGQNLEGAAEAAKLKKRLSAP